MKLGVIAACVIAASTATARADVFAFKDHDGFEKCLNTDHLVETVKTADGEQSRFLSQVEVQMKCIDAAVKLLAGTRNKDTFKAFVDSVKRLSAPENALPLIDLYIGVELAVCNDMANYEVMTKGLGHGEDAYTTRAKKIAKRCLKDEAFKKDFLEEQTNGDSYVAKHACEVLIEEKLVKSCKGRP